jgi:hypothetical protein
MGGEYPGRGLINVREVVDWLKPRISATHRRGHDLLTFLPESQATKNDTTRYPRTMVSFAIVARYWRRALGAARCARAYLWPLSCSMKIISTIGYVEGLTMTAVDGESMRRYQIHDSHSRSVAPSLSSIAKPICLILNLIQQLPRGS